ncbi:MAG: right-handed parallel beta-helix repeat-containing protein [Lentisphaeria bacterium]|nr:right-handed parallel beta-helix repeat-containing protein [Lentisphaeria bacterium]
MNNVKDYGAVGDGLANDTAAVQWAIDAGGMVYFPAGTYLCGTLYLKSNGGLHLGAGAVLLASPRREDYNADDFCPQNWGSVNEKTSGAHFIVALEQQNIIIEGAGRIDGNRQAFYEPPADWTQTWSVQPWEWRPGQMLFFCECSDVRLSGVEMFNAPYWTCYLWGCEDVRVDGLRIWNHPHTRNGDGIDIDCCRNVTVSNCLIESGDDCITLRAKQVKLKNPRLCENVAITNCVLKTICNGIRIGVGTGTIRNAVISNCVIHDSRMGICICARYGPNSAQIENLQFDNLRIDAKLPIVLLGSSVPAKQLRNISFRHIRGTGASSIRVIGHSEGAPVADVSFSDCIFDWTDGGFPTSDPEMLFGGNASLPCPDAAVYLQRTAGVSFDRFQIRWKTDQPGWKYGLRTVDCSGLELWRSDFGRENSLQEK